MPSRSKSQQRLFGMVRACQKTGKCASKEVKKISGEISKKDAEDFAKTKHKGLPNKIKKKKKTRRKMKSFKEWLEYRDQPSALVPSDESFDPKKRLKGKQKNLDVAPPFGKIDAEDFKKLRGNKK